MLIQDFEYTIFHDWLVKYIWEHCLFKHGISEWNIDLREDKSFMAAKTTENLQYCKEHGTPNPDGKIWVWQFYLRRGCFDSTFNSVLSQMFIYKVEREIGHFDFQISGLETAATPMLSAIPLVAKSYGIDLNSFVVKKEQKQYGIRNWVEGCPDPDLPVMIIDDLISTSRSMLIANKILQEKMGLKVMDYVFGIVNKNSRDMRFGYPFEKTKYWPDKKILYLSDLDDYDFNSVDPVSNDLSIYKN